MSYQPRDAPAEETYEQNQKPKPKPKNELDPPTPEYFDVSYKYVFYPGSLTNPQLIDHYKLIMHPFYKRGGLTEGSMDFFINAGNTTIMKNTLTEKMMEYLLMPDEKLHISMYRRHIDHRSGAPWGPHGREGGIFFSRQSRDFFSGKRGSMGGPNLESAHDWVRFLRAQSDSGLKTDSNGTPGQKLEI